MNTLWVIMPSTITLNIMGMQSLNASSILLQYFILTLSFQPWCCNQPLPNSITSFYDLFPSFLIQLFSRPTLSLSRCVYRLYSTSDYVTLLNLCSSILDISLILCIYGIFYFYLSAFDFPIYDSGQELIYYLPDVPFFYNLGDSFASVYSFILELSAFFNYLSVYRSIAILLFLLNVLYIFQLLFLTTLLGLNQLYYYFVMEPNLDRITESSGLSIQLISFSSFKFSSSFFYLFSNIQSLTVDSIGIPLSSVCQRYSLVNLNSSQQNVRRQSSYLIDKSYRINMKR